MLTRSAPRFYQDHTLSRSPSNDTSLTNLTAAPLPNASSKQQTHGVVFPFTNVSFFEVKRLNRAYPAELETIGDHIRKHRLDLGLYQKDVAKFIGVDVCTITNWELGHCEPAIRYGKAIYAFLGYVPFEIGETLAERLKAYRWINGLACKVAARELGVDDSTWRRWESGRYEPKRIELNKRVAQLLETLPLKTRGSR